ncbi:sodium:solute symporter family protein [Natronospora cellulosivora (SeqCode)]
MVLTIVIIYLLVLLAVGYWANSKIKGMDDFLLAGRKLGLVLTAGALTATHFGGGMVMGGGEHGFIHGIAGAWYGIACGVGLLLLGFLTARKFRKLSLYTVPDYLENRYGGKAIRLLSSLLSLVAIIGIIAAQVGAARGALAILGFTGNTAAVVATIIFILYTVLGGLWAATITDFVQVIIAGVGIIVAAALVLGNTGGYSGMQDAILSNHAGLGSGYFNLFGMAGRTIIWILLPTVMYTLIGQDFYQRLFAAKDEVTARKSCFIGGGILIVMSVFPAIAGMGARAYFPDLTDGGQAIPMIVQEVLPIGVGAIVLAALLAAIMSTADSLLTAGSSHVIKDFYLELFRPGEEYDKKELLKLSRICTVVIGLGALIIALAVPTIISALIYSYTMYIGGVFIPVIGGVLWKKATNTGALTSLIGGSLVAIYGILTGFAVGNIPGVVFAAFISLILFVIVSLFTQEKKVA